MFNALYDVDIKREYFFPFAFFYISIVIDKFKTS